MLILNSSYSTLLPSYLFILSQNRPLEVLGISAFTTFRHSPPEGSKEFCISLSLGLWAFSASSGEFLSQSLPRLLSTLL